MGVTKSLQRNTWGWLGIPPAPAAAGPRLPEARIRSRISAYVYGDVLVLASLLAFTSEYHAAWSSVFTIVGTTMTTYVAHVLSDAIGERIGRTQVETVGHLRAELRDAVPIAVAGFVPALAIAAAALRFLPPEAAQVIAATAVVLRLAAVGLITSRLTGRSAPRFTVLSGLAIAILGTAVAVVKAVVAH
jgi:phage-related tail fiber protein